LAEETASAVSDTQEDCAYLERELLRFVKKFEGARDYHNLDIARALVAAAFIRMELEDRDARADFYRHTKGVYERLIGSMRQFLREFGKEYEEERERQKRS
jgi:hypothetical protein